jgi:rhomboid protease GluP
MQHVNVNFITWLKIYFKVTYFLMALNVLFYLFTVFLAVMFFRGDETLPMILLGAQILPGSGAAYTGMIPEIWRFVTAAFLHGGALHLIMNMYAFHSLGLFVEQYYGRRKLFLVYIFTAISSALLSFLVYLWGAMQSGNFPSGLSVSVGASGAIFGLVGLILGNQFFRKNAYAPELNVNSSGLWLFVIINLVIGFGFNFLGSLGSGVYVNNWAHLGGLFGGVILGAILNTKSTFDVTKAKKVFENGLFIFSVVIFIAAWVLNFLSILVNFGRYL